jgi:hypothetical protein
MPKANLLVNLSAILKAEGRRLCRREHDDSAVADLDRSGSQFVVDRSIRSVSDGTGDLQDVLRADIDRPVDDALDDSGVIAKVHKGKMLPVLSTSANPAANPHDSTDITDPDFSAEHISQGGRS